MSRKVFRFRDPAVANLPIRAAVQNGDRDRHELIRSSKLRANSHEAIASTVLMSELSKFGMGDFHGYTPTGYARLRNPVECSEQKGSSKVLLRARRVAPVMAHQELWPKQNFTAPHSCSASRTMMQHLSNGKWHLSNGKWRVAGVSPSGVQYSS